MKLRFLTADKITDPESASRILTKYFNREVRMTLDSQSFEGTILSAKESDGTLRVKFLWSVDENDTESHVEHIHRYAKSKVGSAVMFRAGTDEFVGLLTGLTDIPEGATLDRYIHVPFVLSFSFSSDDQRPLISASKKESGIIGIGVPQSIVDKLPYDSSMEYAPHITVMYFPSLSVEDAEELLPLVRKVAEQIGVFEVVLDGSTTFPTPQEDGTYPHVAKVKSNSLRDLHNSLLEEIEFVRPGMIDRTFTGKNFNPHVTLRYSKEPKAYSSVPSLAWSVDGLELNVGKENKWPVPMHRKVEAATDTEDTYLQIGDLRVPLVILSLGDGEMKVRLPDSSQAAAVDDAEGHQVKLVSSKAEQEIEVLEVRESGPDGFQIFYRTLVTYMPKSSATKLAKVASMARSRGQTGVANKLSKFLDFSEENESDEDDDTDKEALGPGFEGTDSHIVTYVKAPQTQTVVKEPKFTRSLPLHERI